MTERMQLTLQEIDQAINMLKSGVPLEHIAKAMNINEQVLFRQMKMSGYCSKC
jgi:transposase-like protein